MKYLIYILLATGLIQACSNGPKTLPFLGERSTKDTLINGKTVTDTIYQTIAPFRYYNQDSVLISNTDYDGSIYVADFFFTTCGTICPMMTDNMVWLQEKIKGFPEVMLLSHSVTPDIDSVSVLKAYAIDKGVH